MTPEEARAQFPVLERYAYLQAGSVGPLATGTIEAMRAADDEGLVSGRGSLAAFLQLLDEREDLRRELAALVGTSEENVALTASTTDGCNVVLAGLGLRQGDEVVTTTDEHFGLIGPLHTSGATVVVVGDADVVRAPLEALGIGPLEVHALEEDPSDAPAHTGARP